MTPFIDDAKKRDLQALAERLAGALSGANVSGSNLSGWSDPTLARSAWNLYQGYRDIWPQSLAIKDSFQTREAFFEHYRGEEGFRQFLEELGELSFQMVVMGLWFPGMGHRREPLLTRFEAFVRDLGSQQVFWETSLRHVREKNPAWSGLGFDPFGFVYDHLETRWRLLERFRGTDYVPEVGDLDVAKQMRIDRLHQALLLTATRSILPAVLESTRIRPDFETDLGMRALVALREGVWEALMGHLSVWASRLVAPDRFVDESGDPDHARAVVLLRQALAQDPTAQGDGGGPEERLALQSRALEQAEALFSEHPFSEAVSIIGPPYFGRALLPEVEPDLILSLLHHLLSSDEELASHSRRVAYWEIEGNIPIVMRESIQAIGQLATLGGSTLSTPEVEFLACVNFLHTITEIPSCRLSEDLAWTTQELLKLEYFDLWIEALDHRFRTVFDAFHTGEAALETKAFVVKPLERLERVLRLLSQKEQLPEGSPANQRVEVVLKRLVVFQGMIQDAVGLKRRVPH